MSKSKLICSYEEMCMKYILLCIQAEPKLLIGSIFKVTKTCSFTSPYANYHCIFNVVSFSHNKIWPLYMSCFYKKQYILADGRDPSLIFVPSIGQMHRLGYRVSKMHLMLMRPFLHIPVIP